MPMDDFKKGYITGLRFARHIVLDGIRKLDTPEIRGHRCDWRVRMEAAAQSLRDHLENEKLSEVDEDLPTMSSLYGAAPNFPKTIGETDDEPG